MAAPYDGTYVIEGMTVTVTVLENGDMRCDTADNLGKTLDPDVWENLSGTAYYVSSVQRTGRHLVEVFDGIPA